MYRIALPLPNDSLRAVNVYLLRTPDGVLLIDGGWALAASIDRLTASLRELELGLTDITRFLVTHVHRDHYTQAVALRRQLGVPISLGTGEQANLARIIDATRTGRAPFGFEHVERAGGQLLLAQLSAASNGAGPQDEPADRDDWEFPDFWLTDGEELRAGERRLRVISTPGHTTGHVVFHDAEAGLLFAGDHVLPHITPSIGFEPERPAFPLRDYLSSLRVMLTLPDATLLPAHGPVTGSVHQRVTELLGHHAERLDASAAVIAAGAGTGFEAARALTWTRRRRPFAELDLFNQVLAVAETAAHLDVLVLQGRLRSATGPDGIEIYQAGQA